MTPPDADEEPNGSSSPDGATSLVLRLFVMDATPSSVRARAQLRNWLRRSGSDGVQLEVIDVLERPDLAETERVLATPTLIRQHPPPRRKIVGDLSNWEAVARSLDLADGAAR
jgi:circadian clock protein KaiB